MKKLILKVFVLFSVNCFGQVVEQPTEKFNNDADTTLIPDIAIHKDTTYFFRGGQLSMTIKYSKPIPKESPLYNKIMSERLRKKKRRFLGIF